MSVDMDTIELDSILDDCFERMRRGEELESCLATYPDHAEELQSLLIVATDMTLLEVPRTSLQAKEAGRQRMFAAIEAGQSKVSKNNQTIPVSIVGIIRYLEQVQNTFISNLSKEFLVMHKTVIAIVLVLVVVFGGSAASAYAAQGSLPGDALYPMKTAIENASVDFSVDPASEVRLYLSLAEKRIAEIESLGAEGRYDDMEKAVERFKSHVENAIKGLLVVAQGNPAEAKTLAASLGALMEKHTQVLLALMVTSPGEVQATFEDAMEASQEGISAADEFASDGEINENSSPEDEVNANESIADDNGNINDNEDEGYANESEDDDSSDAENSNENGEDLSENENTGDVDEDEGNLNGDDEDDGNLSGDDDDEDQNTNGDDEGESEDENTNGDDGGESEDENTNGDDEGKSEDENTNSDDDSEENSNESDGEDEYANGDDESNENGDTGEEEDGINDNGDDSSEDDSDDANENDNTGEDEDSSDEGDGSGNDNDSSEDDTNENDNGSEDESNENDNSNSEVDEGEIDISKEVENSNS